MVPSLLKYIIWEGRWLINEILNIKQIYMQLRSIMGETVNREAVGTMEVEEE